MFEDTFISPHPEKPPSRDRALGILVTVVVHALLGLIVYFGRVTVRIFPSPGEEVRNVVIVPPLTVSVPKVVGGRGLADVPGGSPGTPGPRRPAAAPDTAAVEEEAGGGGGPAGAAAAEPYGAPGPGWLAPPPGAGSAIPSLSSKFRDSLAVHGRSSLTIPLAPPGTPPGPPGVGGGAPLPDFSRYDRGAYGGGAGGYGRGRGGRGGGGGGGGGQRVGMSVALKGYDLLPWATKVIDRLQVNWMLPAAPEVPVGAKIGMIVVIKKSGELDSIEIVEGTSIETLDRAALDALRVSLPFPPLPADFPGDLLEITFEFVYND